MQHVEGSCAPEFSRVHELFEENFNRLGEVGAAVAVFIDGEPVVDLWGGLARRNEGVAWQRDTLVPMMSVNKGMAALAVHLLVQDGVLELGASVAKYWPEFAQAGKARITLEQVLGHRSGVLYMDKLRRGELFDREKVARAIERQPPAWPDASRGAYHTSTFGPMLDEVVRRVTGRDLAATFDARVNGPLGTEYCFRLDDEKLHRTAHTIERRFNVLRTLILEEPYALRMLRCWRAMPSLGRTGFNSPLWLQSGFPSGAGAGNARALAKIFGELARAGRGGRLLGAEALARATGSSWEGRCWMSGYPTHMALGFALNTPGGAFFGPGARAFGHMGRGGSFGFGDPSFGLGFSYCPTQLTSTGLPDVRSQRLVSAVYAALSERNIGHPRQLG